MMKKLLATLALVFAFGLTAPAYATELNSDVGCDSPGAWMNDPAASSDWSVTGSKCVATNVRSMHMLMGMNTAIKRGHKYKFSVTVSGYSGSGILRLMVGPTMTGTVPGSWVLASSQPAIADNFTTANGLTASGYTHTTNEVGGFGQESAYRFTCAAGPMSWTDPVVYPGLWGRSHIHGFYGNLQAIDPNTTYATLRAKGMSTCSAMQTPQYATNRSGYWHPAMIDDQFLKKPDAVNLYYKLFTPTDPWCKSTPSGLGACVKPPFGIRMIRGYDFSTGTGGPSGVNNSSFGYNCLDVNGVNKSVSGGATFTSTMSAWYGVCVPGDTLGMNMIFWDCWDGVNIDSPNHRDHMYTGGFVFSNCPDAFPYHLPHIQLQIWWAVDANFALGKWHLSSDEMVDGAAPGSTFHADYWEGWSPSVMTTLKANCWDKGYTCSDGDIGDGTKMKDSGWRPWCSCVPGGAPFSAHDPNSLVPFAQLGMSHDIKANGTYTGELTAVADGRFSLAGFNGLNASVDNISIQEVTQGHHGSVTVTN